MKKLILASVLLLASVAHAAGFDTPRSGLLVPGTLSGNLDLGGYRLLLNGSTSNDLNGHMFYTSSNGRRLVLGIPYNSDPGNPRINLCVGFGSVADGGYSESGCSGGLSIGPQADIVILGNQASGTNVNTYGNDTALVIGAGVSTVRGDAHAFYNSAKLSAVTDEMKASANEQNFAHFATTVNQTGTASYNLIYGEVHATSHGTGPQRLLSLGVNSNTSTGMITSTAVAAGTDNAGYTPSAIIDVSGNLEVAAAAKLGWTTFSSGGAQSDITQLTAPADGVLAVNIGAGTASSTLPSILLGANATTGVRLRRTGNGAAELDNGDTSASASLTVGSFVADASGTMVVNSGAGVNFKAQAFVDSPSSNNLECLNAAGNALCTFNQKLQVGSGTTILKHMSTTASLNFANQAAIGCNDLTVSDSNITGAAVGDTVSIGVPNASVVNGTASFTGWVSSANTVSVRYCQLTSGDPAAGTFRVDVWQH